MRLTNWIPTSISLLSNFNPALGARCGRSRRSFPCCAVAVAAPAARTAIAAAQGIRERDHLDRVDLISPSLVASEPGRRSDRRTERRLKRPRTDFRPEPGSVCETHGAGRVTRGARNRIRSGNRSTLRLLGEDHRLL